MAASRAYLDYNASAPLRPSAREAMSAVLGLHGNASSVHGEGRQMRRAVEAARAQVAALVNADVEGVIFTASATEAAHLALTPDVHVDGEAKPADKLLVLETEHPCVLAGGRFAPEDVLGIPVLQSGVVDLPAFEALLDGLEGAIPFVAIQMVNSETGVVQPVRDVALKTRLKSGYTLCDAVQAAGRMPLDMKELGADFMLLSAHKLGGPNGAGALVYGSAIVEVPAAIRGGGQEKNRRAGTENVAAIAGFGAAAAEAGAEAHNYSATAALRDSIEDELTPICAALGLGDRLTIFGQNADRAGNTLLFSLEGLKAETALIAFDLEGVAVSSGSACSSGKVGSSHVLQAMDVEPGVAHGAIRVSLGWNSSREDKEKFLTAFTRIATKLSERLETKLSGAA